MVLYNELRHIRAAPEPGRAADFQAIRKKCRQNAGKTLDRFRDRGYDKSMEAKQPYTQAHNLKAIRRAHGLTTTALASILGVADSTVLRNEAGRPSLKYIGRFCAELHVDPAVLVAGWIQVEFK